jgi:hypothetical protein
MPQVVFSQAIGGKFRISQFDANQILKVCVSLRAHETSVPGRGDTFVSFLFFLNLKKTLPENSSTK